MRPCTPLTLRLSWPVRGPARPVGPQRYRELLADVLRQRDWPVALGTVPGTKGGSQDGSTTPSWSRGSPWRAEAPEAAVGLDAQPLKIQYVIEAQRPAVSEIRVPTKDGNASVVRHGADRPRGLEMFGGDANALPQISEHAPCVTSRPPSRPWAR